MQQVTRRRRALHAHRRPPFPPFSPTQDTFAPWGGDPLVGPDGTLYVPKRFNSQPWIAISHDEGLTWTDVQIADNGSGGEANRGALDSAGNVYYAWVDGAHHEPYLAYSRDRGRTWSKPIALAPSGRDRGRAAPPGRRPQPPGTGRRSPGSGARTPPAMPRSTPTAMCCSRRAPTPTTRGATWNGYLTEIQNVFACQAGPPDRHREPA